MLEVNVLKCVEASNDMGVRFSIGPILVSSAAIDWGLSIHRQWRLELSRPPPQYMVVDNSFYEMLERGEAAGANGESSPVEQRPETEA